jgi:hypothetical protein
MRRDAGGKPSVIIEGDGCGQARFSPDGTRLAWYVTARWRSTGNRCSSSVPRRRAGVVIRRALVRLGSGGRRARVVPERGRLRPARNRRAGRRSARELSKGWHRGITWTEQGIACVRSGAVTPPSSRRARTQRIGTTRDRTRCGRRFRSDGPHRTASRVVEVGGRDGARVVVARVQRARNGCASCTGARPGRRLPIGIRVSSGSCRTASPCCSRTTAARRATAPRIARARRPWGVRDVADTAAGIRHAVREGWCDAAASR